MRPLELAGQKFFRLTVVSIAPSRDGARWWNCEYECGASKDIRGADLRRGYVTSCGCWLREMPAARKTHGLSHTRLYRIWQGMRDRTGNPDASRYAYYGGRGIAVCSEWQDFSTFSDWALSHGYAGNLSIDRIDNDGNYEPANCRWATQSQQVRNRRPRTA